MKRKWIIAVVAVLISVGTAQAQIGGALNRAAKRGAKKAVERQVEKKTEQAVENAVDDAIENANKEEEKNKEKTEAKAAKEETPAKPRISYGTITDTEPFFYAKEGSVLVFANKNAKGNTDSQTRTTVTKVTGAGKNLTINYSSEILDAKGKSTSKSVVIDCSISVKEGVLIVDMRSLFATTSGTENAEIKGTPIEIPNNLSVGMELNDASINFMGIETKITEMKCLAQENITTPAGTFSCYKVTQTSTAKVFGFKTKCTTLSWYAKGVGAVKTENYDEKGNLISSNELIQIK